MAKKPSGAARAGIKNDPLETFLIELAVDDNLRQRYTNGSPDDRRQIMSKEFNLGPKTIEDILSGDADRVAVRLGMADQTGSGSIPPTKKRAGKKR